MKLKSKDLELSAKQDPEHEHLLLVIMPDGNEQRFTKQMVGLLFELKESAKKEKI